MIKLTILVDDIDNVISIFTHIRLYTSDSETGTYTHLAYVLLVAGQTEYSYTHVTGTEDTWYKSSYYNMDSSLESSLSEAVQGVSAELYHYPTFPDEVDFNSFEKTIIRKIRRLIGDLKGLDRLYVDGTDEYTMSSALQPDGHTIFLEERGWPVYIAVNDVEETSISSAIVQGYQYITFSGTVGDTDKINVWYYTFKFSDREIMEAYNDSQMPPGITSSTINQDMLILQSAIDLLENMWAQDSVENGSNVRDDSSIYNPSPGLLERSKILDNLKKQLNALIKQYIMSGISGVLVD